MENNKSVDFEDKEIKINILESLEVNLAPMSYKKRRQVDDYDYNDPFLESFEGELDAVEVECKLENFFVHKGEMKDDPKRIIKKYRRQQQKSLRNNENLADIKPNNTNPLVFPFENKLAHLFKTKAKYKKDNIFGNSIIDFLKLQICEDEFDGFLGDTLIALNEKMTKNFIEKNNSKEENDTSSKEQLENSQNVTGKEFREYISSNLAKLDPDGTKLAKLREKIQRNFNIIEKLVCDIENYSPDKKLFKKFEEDDYLSSATEFILIYMKYYSVASEMQYAHIRNSAMEYLIIMIPSHCTNRSKMKHYLAKYINDKLKNNFSGSDIRDTSNISRADDGMDSLLVTNNIKTDVEQPVKRDLKPRGSNLDGFLTDNNTMKTKVAHGQETGNQSELDLAHIKISRSKKKVISNDLPNLNADSNKLKNVSINGKVEITIPYKVKSSPKVNKKKKGTSVENEIVDHADSLNFNID